MLLDLGEELNQENIKMKHQSDDKEINEICNIPLIKAIRERMAGSREFSHLGRGEQVPVIDGGHYEFPGQRVH